MIWLQVKALAQLAAHFFVATPSRILFERSVNEKPSIRSSILHQRISSSWPWFQRQPTVFESGLPFTSSLKSILGVLCGDRDSVADSLLYVGHAGLWALSVPFIQNSVLESARDFLYTAYAQYARARRATNDRFYPYLSTELNRPFTFAAKSIAYAVSFPFFLCAFKVRKNGPKQWNKITSSFLSDKKPIPSTALWVYILVAHLQSSLFEGIHSLLFQLRARGVRSAVALSHPSEQMEGFIRNLEYLIASVAAGVILLPLEVVLLTMLSKHIGFFPSISLTWKQKGLAGFFNGFGWFLLTHYLSAEVALW